MNTPDLSPLIKGIIPLVGIALALGQFGRLQHWARTQALHAIAWQEPLPYFFAPPYGTHKKAKPHAHAVTNAHLSAHRLEHSAE